MNGGSVRSKQVNRRVVFYRLRYSIQFSLRCKSDSDVGSIVGSITHESQRIRFSLGFNRIPLIHWDSRRQRVLPSYSGYNEINTELDRLIERVHLFFSTGSNNIISHTDPVFTLSQLHTHLFPHQRKSNETHQKNSIVRLFNRFINEHTNKGKSLSNGTLKQYKVVLFSWKMFEKEIGKSFIVSDFYIRTKSEESSSKRNIESFRRFLTERGGNGLPLSDNTTRNYLKILNTFFRWMERDCGIPLVREIRMSGEMVSKYSVSLTLEEVEKIRQLELKPDTTLYHIRNMMILMTLTGLRFSEWELIRPELFREPFQLVVSPKTGKSCLLIHRQEVRDVLSEYEKSGIPKCVLTNQVVNRGIKEVSELSG